MLSGGRLAVGRGASVLGATVEEGWLAAFGEESGSTVEDGEEVEEAPLISGGLFGFVIGMADLATVREAIKLARAR